jgi:hypothetical protein
MATFNGRGLGWTFDLELDDATGMPVPGGLALKQIRHDGHSFAHDIRLIGVWMTLEQVDTNGHVTGTQSKLATLDSKSFTPLSGIRTLEPKAVKNPITRGTFDYLREADAALNFSDYFESRGNSIAYGVAIKYNAPSLFADLHVDNCESAGLLIEEIFLFARYADDPPHEPSGALSAARFHPLVSYELSQNLNCDRSKTFTRIKSLRFDFRLHLYLDRYYTDNFGPMADAPGGAKNQAGLFADTDIGTARILKRGVLGSTGVEEIAFYAVEKPLVTEVTAPGLIDGDPKGVMPGSKDKIICWDNIHWWGAQTLGKRVGDTKGTLTTTQLMISTPGAFHAAHTHWRWGETVGSWAGRIGASAWRRFNPGDALLDPRVPLQTLLVAITKYRKNQDPEHAALQDLTKAQWDTLFHDSSNYPPPETIHDGANIVLWYSTEVSRTGFVMPPAGTVFLHGIFFAHDAEKTGSTVGSRDSLYRPRSLFDLYNKKQWLRPAND